MKVKLALVLLAVVVIIQFGKRLTDGGDSVRAEQQRTPAQTGTAPSLPRASASNAS